MYNIKSGDTVFFNGLSSTVLNVFPISNTDFNLTIYNKYDGEIEVNISEITLNP